MTSKWFTSILCGAALLGMTLGSALPAGAEQAPSKNGPGVARVSVLQGKAVVQRGDSNDQVAATLNAPLLPGDYISTGSTSRAELQFDGYTAVRLGGNVQARITNDDPNNRSIQLADGTMEFGLVRDARPFQIDTPSVSVRSQTAGDYRISITGDGATWVSVRSGRAQVVTPQQDYVLEQGKTLVARGSASEPAISYTSEVGYDSFDDFSAKRDRTMLAAINASPNVSPDIAGYDNLDAYGQWQDVSGYGQSWVPNEPSSWAPYQNGSWTWEDGYGWTWVSADPWGWAPYHYGRWTYANGYGWAWVPPAYVGYYNVQPAWSPALVGFFGFGLSVGGPGFGVNVGFGGYPYVGWYPLAPYAPYYPWYPGWGWTGYGWGWPTVGVGFGWGGWGGYPGWGTSITRVVNINNYYRYFGHHGVTGTLAGNFHNGDFLHNSSVNPREISNMGTIRGALPVTPSRNNLSFSRGGGTLTNHLTMSKAFDSPRFASNRALAARPSFDEQQHAVTQAIHGDVAGSSERNAPVSHDNATLHDSAVQRDNAVQHDNAPSSSWQRFNESRGTQGRESAMSGSSQRSDFSRSSSLEGSRDTTERNAAENRAPSDSWNRFTQSRGSLSSERGSYAQRSESYGSEASRGSYGRESSTPSYSRGGSSSPSYSRGGDSFPTYHGESNSYPSYSHSSGSYPSYSRSSGSYPSYSRGSGSYPSYSRGSGSYPSYHGGSAPSYSHGASGSAPHPSGGGGNSGGSHGGDGRHPPQ